MVTYDSKDKVLFSADGFGKFGALDVEEDWDCEARRYYFGIVGKYGAQVQLTMYKETTGLDETSFVSGRGHRKSIQQKQYEELHEYLERLKSYAYHIETCGEERNSYSKTDHDATFMRLKA